MNAPPSLYQAYVKADKPAMRAAEVIIDSMEPINWPELIAELQAGGASFSSIATCIGCSKGTVQRWANGSMPGYEFGKKLLAMRAACNSGQVSEAEAV